MGFLCCVSSFTTEFQRILIRWMVIPPQTFILEKLIRRKSAARQFLENHSSDPIPAASSDMSSRLATFRNFESCIRASIPLLPHAENPVRLAGSREAKLLAWTNRRLISPRRNEFLPRSVTREGCWLLQPSPRIVTHATRRGIYEAASLVVRLIRLDYLRATAPALTPSLSLSLSRCLDYYTIKMWRPVGTALNYKGWSVDRFN